jgi:hypothetical protein
VSQNLGMELLSLATAKSHIQPLTFNYPVLGIQVNQINNHGKICGLVQNRNDLSLSGFVWSNGVGSVISELQDLTDINDEGNGIGATRQGEKVFIEGGTSYPIDKQGYTYAFPSKINNANIIFGHLVNAPDTDDLVCWQKAAFLRRIPYPKGYDGYYSAYSLSDAGKVYGQCREIATSTFVPCVIDLNAASISIIDVSTLRKGRDDPGSGAASGEFLGAILGSAFPIGEDRNDRPIPYMHSNKGLQIIDMPQKGTYVSCVNGKGIAGGMYSIYNQAGFDDTRAYCYDLINRQYMDLSRLAKQLDAGWDFLTYARRINNNNELTGYGQYRGVPGSAFYLKL